MFNQMVSENIFGLFWRWYIGRMVKEKKSDICYRSTQKNQKVESETKDSHDLEDSKLQERLWEMTHAMVSETLKVYRTGKVERGQLKSSFPQLVYAWHANALIELN